MIKQLNKKAAVLMWTVLRVALSKTFRLWYRKADADLLDAIVFTTNHPKLERFIVDLVEEFGLEAWLPSPRVMRRCMEIKPIVVDLLVERLEALGYEPELTKLLRKRFEQRKCEQFVDYDRCV